MDLGVPDPNAEMAIMPSDIEQIRQGRTAAFEKLFRLFSARLIHFASRLVCDRQVAENVVQDVFVNIWQNRATLDPSKNIRSFLYTSVKNRALDHLKHDKLKRAVHDHLIFPESDSPEDLLLEKEFQDAVGHCINSLPGRCRLIFEMNRFDGLTYSEIAETLHISVKTVETQMSRALKILRRQLRAFLHS